MPGVVLNTELDKRVNSRVKFGGGPDGSGGKVLHARALARWRRLRGAKLGNPRFLARTARHEPLEGRLQHGLPSSRGYITSYMAFCDQTRVGTVAQNFAGLNLRPVTIRFLLTHVCRLVKESPMTHFPTVQFRPVDVESTTV
jgi:hypothetical protein